MATLGIFQTGSLSNQTVCQITAGLPSTPSAPVSGTPYTNIPMILTARYHLTAGAGVSAGTGTFQEISEDGVTWRNIADVSAVSFGAPGEFTGTLTGPFLGLRILLSTITGGVISFASLKGAIVL